MSWPIVGADDAVAERYFGVAESFDPDRFDL